MRIFTYPSQDAAVFQAFLSRNTGLDEILEVGKSASTSSIPSSLNATRFLIQFDLSYISTSYANGNIPLNANHFLNLRVAYASGLQNNQSLYVYMVSQSWTEGTGYLAQDLYNPNDGVTWTQRDISGNAWPSGTGPTYVNDGFAPTASITFAYPPSDIRLDVTSFVNTWISSSYENDGFLFKLSDADEGNNTNTVSFKLYSNQTHTIYRPTLETMWPVQTFSTGNLNPIPNFYIYPYIRNLMPVYYSGSFARIDVAVRNAYPIKTFDTIFEFVPQYYLPTSSYYSITDAQTNSTVIPFDTGSLISCDISSSFFDLNFQNMYTNRLYNILIRVDMNGNSMVFNTSQFRIR